MIDNDTLLIILFLILFGCEIAVHKRDLSQVLFKLFQKFTAGGK